MGYKLNTAINGDLYSSTNMTFNQNVFVTTQVKDTHYDDDEPVH